MRLSLLHVVPMFWGVVLTLRRCLVDSCLNTRPVGPQSLPASVLSDDVDSSLRNRACCDILISVGLTPSLPRFVRRSGSPLSSSRFWGPAVESLV